ncbi:MAG: O-acetyl-ADP-ribose deacetylase [Planctomycetes bacterium]|nr:O-acetyl-ADP-ribose deacetylase [Planctomycetota bacterium]
MDQRTYEALGRIDCHRGDITRERVDAVVNAANAGLLGGGGVDGAIHRAAGPELLAACRREHPAGCPTGEARLTAGFALEARFVIHAVGPIWQGGGAGEAGLLASAYLWSMRLAREAGCLSVAFPAISCGVYGYPHGAAAQIALRAVAESALAEGAPRDLRFVLFSEEMLATFQAARTHLLAEAKGGGPG